MNSQSNTQTSERCRSIERCFCFVKREFFPWRSFVVYFRKRWSGNQDDHQRQKSFSVTYLKNPQRCSWLVVRQDQFRPHDPNQVCRIQDSTRNIFTKRHITRDAWNNLLCLLNISLFSSQSCSEVSSQNRSEAIAKRPQESAYDESVLAKSKPVRNLAWRSRAWLSTVPSSTVLTRHWNLGSGDHEMRCEANTVQPVVQNSQRDLAKGGTMKNAQVRHSDARSKARTMSQGHKSRTKWRILKQERGNSS